MLSVSGIKWKETLVSNRVIDKVKLDLNLSKILSKTIISKKFDEYEINSLKQNIELLNPFIKNKDFKKGHFILRETIKSNKNILVIGDYDVDGCVSVSLFVNYMKFYNKNIDYFIPNRFTDGYGVDLKLINKLTKKKPELVILLDCGSSSFEAINFLKSKKIKSIIIDHHEIYYPYPKSECLINPKKKCDYNDYDYFCSSSLTYFFLNSFNDNLEIKKNFEKNLILVLLATICDVMPLRKLNRQIAIKVLDNIVNYDNFLFNKIFEIKKIKRKIEIDDFGFLFGPILNSAGRLGDANKIVELITSNNLQFKNKLLLDLIKINEKRKKIEDRFLQNLDFDEIKNSVDDVLILNKHILNEGIIGIIASRLKDYFNKPTIILTNSNNKLKASARSTINFNIGKFIKQAIDKKIILKGGGHNLAAGFTIKKDKLINLKVFMNKACSLNRSYNHNEYISKLSLNAINIEFFNKLNLLGPFGSQNESPIFLLENIKIFKPKILEKKFISFYAKSNTGKMVPSISFNFIDSQVNKTLLYNKNEVSLIVQIKQNIWNNKKKLQLNVLDIIVDLN